MRGSHRVLMQEPAYTVFAAANPEFDAAAFRFNYQSPITPSSWFDYAPGTRARTLVKQTQVPGFDGAKYLGMSTSFCQFTFKRF